MHASRSLGPSVHLLGLSIAATVLGAGVYLFARPTAVGFLGSTDLHHPLLNLPAPLWGVAPSFFHAAALTLAMGALLGPPATAVWKAPLVSGLLCVALEAVQAPFSTVALLQLGVQDWPGGAALVAYSARGVCDAGDFIVIAGGVTAAAYLIRRVFK